MSMQHWQCVQGHHWDQPNTEPPHACPVCGREPVRDDPSLVNSTPAQIKLAPPADADSETMTRTASAPRGKKTVPMFRSPPNQPPRPAEDDTFRQPDGSVSLDNAQSTPIGAVGSDSGSAYDETLDRVPRPLDSGKATARPAGGATHLPAPLPDHADDLTEIGSGAPPAPRAQPIPPRQRIGGYEILQELGRGGMGVVYKARQLKLNRLAALKMILAGSHASGADLERFQSEARAVAQLQHPNIVQIFEVGEADGRPFFSLEFVDGGSLKDRLNGTPLQPRQAAELVLPLARAMHYAHEQGIIHRDLKPANVLLTRQGLPKITDFGLAKSFREDSSHTGTGAILGTPSYMSPEQADGRTNEIGPASDIYSLGALFYDMLTGRPPFRGQTVLDTLHQVQHVDPVPPRRLQPNIPRDLETICLRCLHKEPQRRYATGQDLAADLQRFLAGEPIQARPVSAWERGYKWARRRPAIAGLLAALALVVIGGLIGMTILWLQAEAALFVADRAQKALQEETEAAVKARDVAQREHKTAEEAKEVAVQEKKKAYDNFLLSQRHLYVTRMKATQHALDEGQDALALEALLGLKKLADKWHKDQPQQEELRGFEWYYTWHQCHSDVSRRLKGHASHITEVAFSPDGNLLATAALDHTVKIWDIHKGREITPAPPRSDSPIRCLTFRPDAKLLAIGTLDGTIYRWDLIKQQAQKPLKAHRLAVRGLAFSPDGQRLASASDDRTVRIWEAATGKWIQTLEGPKERRHPVTCVAFPSSGPYLAAAGEDTAVTLWNLSSGTVEVTFVGHTNWVSCLAFSSDGQRLTSGSWDRTIRIWDMSGQKAPQVLTGEKRPIRSVAFSPEGSKLAAAAEDGHVKVWDLLNNLEPQDFPVRPEYVRTVAFSADGELLASIQFVLRQMDFAPIFRAHHSPITALAVTPDSKTVLSSDNGLAATKGRTTGELYIWDLLHRDKKTLLPAAAGPIRTLAVDSEGRLLAVGSEDRTVRLFDLASRQEIARFTGHTGRVRTVAFHPRGQYLASAGEDGVIQCWDLATHKSAYTLPGDPGVVVLQIAFSPDGKYLAAAADDRTVQLWDLATRTVQRTFKGHTGPVTTVAFHPREPLLATGSADQTVRLWDYTTGKKYLPLARHFDGVTQVLFTPDGNRLASASLDHTIILWDRTTREETLILQDHSDGVTCIAFTPDGNYLLSGSLDQTVRIWDGSRPPESKSNR
jgi:WD40 repeat protein/tRNA A-37 threonylcarbamoyl transferase component Bud32